MFYIGFHGPGNIIRMAHRFQACFPGKAGLNSSGVYNHTGMDLLPCYGHSPPAAFQGESPPLPAEERDSGLFREVEIEIIELLPVNEVAPCRDGYALAGRAENAHAIQLFLQVAVLHFYA